MLIGDRLKKARLDIQMSQEQLSQETGISQQTISTYERNLTEPGYTQLCLLVKHLNINPYKVLGLEEPVDYGRQTLRWLKSKAGRLKTQDNPIYCFYDMIIEQIEEEEHLK